MFSGVGCEVLTAVVMDFAVFWDIAPCSLYVNRRSTETSVHIRTKQCYVAENDNVQDIGTSVLVFIVEKTCVEGNMWYLSIS
jgi:hypothetical protein